MTNDSTDLFAVLNEVLQRPENEPLTWESNLAVLGLDSIATVETTLQIEERYDIEFPDRALVPQTFATPAALWAQVELAMGEHTEASR